MASLDASEVSWAAAPSLHVHASDDGIRYHVVLIPGRIMGPLRSSFPILWNT